MKKILVVDDDAAIRETLKTVLAKRYVVTEADGKDSAKKLLASFGPDLVILDVMMETISSGFDLAREIKKQKTAPKILMLTSVDQDTKIDFRSEAGDGEWLPVDGYCSKPVVPKALLEKIAVLLK